MQPDEERRRPLIVPVGDSKDARLLVELSSHAADLTVARQAAALALVADEDPGLAEAKPALIGYAVVSYCRTIMPSKVRRPVTELVSLSSKQQRTSDAIRLFRNRAVAHSQSDLSTTHAVGLLDPDTFEVLAVAAPTVSFTLPDELVRELVDLIDFLEDQIDHVLAPVRQRLHDELSAMDRESLVASATALTVTHKSVSEFDATTKRPPYPESQTIYWTPEP